jgi:hypothetical protein
MKKKYLFKLIVLATIISVVSCKKRAASDCGCDSQPIQSINEWKGYLFFNAPEKKYEVEIGSTDYFICNTSFAQMKSIIDTNQNIMYPVIFSGNVNKFCVPDSIAGYIDMRYNIKLTNIIKR